MTIEERARDYAVHVSIDELNKDGLDAESFCGILHGYIKGATEQRKIDIDKACEWLWQNIEQCIFEDMALDEILQEFRKAMEGNV